MIITNIGSDESHGDDQLTITKVILSDFDFSNYGKNDIKQVIEIKGDNLKSVVPTVGLLANGNAIVQTDVDTEFRPLSAFIFANNGNYEFLLAIEEHLLGNLNATISIDALQKIKTNAIASDLVRKSELKSLVASAYSSIDHSANSNATVSGNYDSSFNDFNNRLNSKANISSLAVYAKQQTLSSYALVTDLNNYAKQSDVSSNLSSYATNFSVNQLASGLENEITTKADASSLNSYATKFNLSQMFGNISVLLSSKADNTALSNYMSNDSANSLTLDLHNQIAAKADITLLKNYVTSAAFSKLTLDTANQIASKANITDLEGYANQSTVDINSVALRSTINSNASKASMDNVTTLNQLNTFSANQSSFNGWTWSEATKLESWIVNNNAEIVKNRNEMSANMSIANSKVNSLASVVDSIRNK